MTRANVHDIPREILDHIIDHLHDDIPSLLSCALVHHSWLPSCRFHLFNTLHCSYSPSHKNTLFRFSKWVLASPDVVPYVTSLVLGRTTIATVYSIYLRFKVEDLQKVLSHLPNLQQLIINDAVINCSPLSDIALDFPHPRPIKDLRLILCGATMGSRHALFRLLGVFSEVGRLTIQHSEYFMHALERFDSYVDQLEVLHLLSHLRVTDYFYFRLLRPHCRNATARVILRLLEQPPYPRWPLQRLIIVGPVGTELDNYEFVWQVIECCKGTLRELGIEVFIPIDFNFEASRWANPYKVPLALWRNPLLGKCTHLERLQLFYPFRLVGWIGFRKDRRIIATSFDANVEILRSAPGTLQTVDLQIVLCDADSVVDVLQLWRALPWANLDVELLRFPMLHHVRAVICVVIGSADFQRLHISGQLYTADLGRSHSVLPGGNDDISDAVGAYGVFLTDALPQVHARGLLEVATVNRKPIKC